MLGECGASDQTPVGQQEQQEWLRPLGSLSLPLTRGLAGPDAVQDSRSHTQCASLLGAAE
ncbi:hypothetical protein DMX01_11555 [Pseudomonas fulva]|nr:hypothetical protein DMX01_11555 [Pseudomonas fulva]PYC13250.1 hypothetical protein DMX00_12155 [Pseudomonas fulva]HCP28170.1 hypothetical protein [Pseudomonas sp.]